MLEICRLSALPRGEARRVESDPPIAVFHTNDGEVFAIDDTCTHQDASLADGWLEGCEIECPLHASRFDLRTGAVDATPAKLPVRTHEVVIVDGVINVVLDDAVPNLPHGVSTRAAARRHSEKRCGDRRLTGGSVRCPRVARAGFRRGADHRRRRDAAPYDRPPLSKEFLAGVVGEDDLALESDDEDLHANWVIGVHARRLDAAAGAVVLDDGTTIRADGVVVATGARARVWPGAEGLAGVHVLRTIDDALALRDELRPGVRLAVIGAGFIGAEVASTATKLGLDVTVVEAAPTPLAGPLGERLGAVVARLHAEHGTRLLCGVGVAGLTGGDRVTGVELTDGHRVPADVMLVGIGAVPNVEWLRDGPLELANGVVCDEGGATSIPNVVAVGDCAAWHEPCVGWPHRVEHWTGALERPAIAVATLLAGGRHNGTPARPPYFWSDQYGSRIQFAGIAGPHDEITFEVGSADEASFLAVYRRGDRPVAVLGVDQPRMFTRWRRQLGSVPAAS